MPTPPKEARGEITRAWWAWNAFCAGAVIMVSATIVNTAGVPAHETGAAAWLLLPAIVWAFLLVPAVLVLKSGVLVAPWQKRPADAAGYRRGLMLVWAVLEVGVVIACIAAMVADSFLPGGLLAGLLTMGLLALRPSGNAVGAAA